jgi:hypothetical protein
MAFYAPPFPRGQLTEHGAGAALGGLELQDGVVDPETAKEFVADHFSEGFGAAQGLIGHLHMAGGVGIC